MAGEQPVSRRRALESIGTAVTVATAGTATARQSPTEGNRSPETGAEADPSRSGGSPGTDGGVGTDLTGLYAGTVDRVVDGDHVVILVESGGEVIDQHVVPAEEYPFLEERDAVYLFIMFGQVLAVWEVPGE